MDSFKLLKMNRVVSPELRRRRYRPRVGDIDTCECTPMDADPCGLQSQCLNRLLNIECHAKYCPAGDKCANQMFRRCKYAAVERFQTEKCGYGLRAMEDMPRGTFVIEYIGEIVSKAEFERRQAALNAIGDSRFYVAELDNKRMIDARRAGNDARFFNHSCAPNCEPETWMVDGDKRIGLFTNQAVKMGMELTWHYDAEFAVDGTLPPCFCQAPTCTGVITRRVRRRRH